MLGCVGGGTRDEEARDERVRHEGCSDPYEVSTGVRQAPAASVTKRSSRLECEEHEETNREHRPHGSFEEFRFHGADHLTPCRRYWQEALERECGTERPG
jgi:hypothetical protein